MRQAILIYNPMAGRRRSQRMLPAILKTLRDAGFEVEPRPTAAAGDATRLASRACGESGLEAVFALGGDGTLREVAAGLVGSDLTLAFLPLGTVNVMALELGLPRDALAAARAVERLEPRAIDVGLCGDQPFLMAASAGLDAAVMAGQNPALKRRLGPPAVFVSGLAHWWRYTYPAIELEADGERMTAVLAVACNAAYYGGAFRLAPDAALDDGLLDLVLLHADDARGGRAATVGFWRDMARGRVMGRADVEHRQVREVTVLGPPDVAVQVDGDVATAHPPLRIGLATEKLRVLLGPRRR